MGISIDRIISKLDEYLYKNDYASAERHLLYWLSEALNEQNASAEMLVRNELMGLYRKLGRKAEALENADTALKRIDTLGIGHQVGAATTYLNSATVYKAFGMAEKGMPLFEKARDIYEKELDGNDSRLGGLYNNMALSLVDMGRYEEANRLYRKAVLVMERLENGSLEVAITYLNMASALEAEYGLTDAEERIQEYVEKAQGLLEECEQRDGYYAFVCEKCASVFDYYGYFLYAAELKERARRIYENAGT